jgi:class 3 adenylate cyclase
MGAQLGDSSLCVKPTIDTSVSPFLHQIPWWRTLKFKIVAAMLVVVVLVAGVLFGTNYVLRKRSQLDEFQRLVATMAGTGAVAIAGEDVEAVEVESDAVTPEFQRMRRALDDIRRRNGLHEGEIYVLRPLPDGQDPVETEFVVMTHKVPFIGNRYVIRQENRAAYRQALGAGQASFTGIYEDDHGTWISGYAPILDGERKVIAVIEVDAEISRYTTALRREVLLVLAVTLGTFLIALVPVYFFADRLTQGTRKLAAAIRRFEDGQTDAQVEMRSHDEIAAIGQTFNRMADSVGEKLEMLPFVSQFTVQAITRGREQNDPNALAGREQEVVVLFTDIRGFTRSSRVHTAPVLVDRLNNLLAVQTEVILKHGGDVDKFIGDSVMAVFVDHADAAERAVLCGRELLARVRVELKELAQEWALGVGIDTGRAVLGAIGSAARRDYTVIGYPVNRAAHLCAKAQAWQMLATHAVFEKMKPELKEKFREEIDVVLKHEREPLRVHSYLRESVTLFPWR